MKRCSSSVPGRLACVPVDLYGWESEGQFWHGPTELTHLTSCFDALVPASGFCAWTTETVDPGGLPLTLGIAARDLGDCALVTIDVPDLCPGPVSIVATIPAHRRPLLRPEFPFELTAFVRFLEGPTTAGSEFKIHDQIERVLAGEHQRSVVFAFCRVGCREDLSIAVSEHIERLAVALPGWLRLRDSKLRPESV